MRSIIVNTVLLGMLSLASAVSIEPERACLTSSQTQLPSNNDASSVESPMPIENSPPVDTSPPSMISSPSKSHPGRVWRQRCGWISENAFLRGEYICYSYETIVSSAGPRSTVPKKLLLVLATLVTVALTSASASTVTITETIPVGPITTEQQQPPASTIAATTVTIPELPAPSTSEVPACVMHCGYVAIGPFTVKKMCWCQTLEELAMASTAPKSTGPTRLLLVLVALVAVVLASDWIPTITRTETTTATIMLPASTVTEVKEAETVTESVMMTHAPPSPTEAPACQPLENPKPEPTSGASGSKVPVVAMIMLSFLTVTVLGWPGERRSDRPQTKQLVVTTTVEHTTTERQPAATVTLTGKSKADKSDSPVYEDQYQLPDFEDWILDAGKMAGDLIHDLATETKTEIDSQVVKGSGESPGPTRTLKAQHLKVLIDSGDEGAKSVVDRLEGLILDVIRSEE